MSKNGEECKTSSQVVGIKITLLSSRDRHFGCLKDKLCSMFVK